jgi:hypothetical protein
MPSSTTILLRLNRRKQKLWPICYDCEQQITFPLLSCGEGRNKISHEKFVKNNPLIAKIQKFEFDPICIDAVPAENSSIDRSREIRSRQHPFCHRIFITSGREMLSKQDCKGRIFFLAMMI